MIQIKYFLVCNEIDILETNDVYTKIEFDDKYNLIGLYEQYYQKEKDPLRIKALFKKNLLQECITYHFNGNIHKDYIHKKYYKEYDENNNLIINYDYDEIKNKFYNPNDLYEAFNEYDKEDKDEGEETEYSELRAKQSVHITEEVKYIKNMIKGGYNIIINNH